jgi:hypothetical protein
MTTHRMRDVRPFIRDGFGGAEAASCSVLQALNYEEVASLLAGAELRANMGSQLPDLAFTPWSKDTSRKSQDKSSP